MFILLNSLSVLIMSQLFGAMVRTALITTQLLCSSVLESLPSKEDFEKLSREEKDVLFADIWVAFELIPHRQRCLMPNCMLDRYNELFKEELEGNFLMSVGLSIRSDEGKTWATRVIAVTHAFIEEMETILARERSPLRDHADLVSSLRLRCFYVFETNLMKDTSDSSLVDLSCPLPILTRSVLLNIVRLFLPSVIKEESKAWKKFFSTVSFCLLFFLDIILTCLGCWCC